MRSRAQVLKETLSSGDLSELQGHVIKFPWRTAGVSYCDWCVLSTCEI